MEFQQHSKAYKMKSNVPKTHYGDPYYYLEHRMKIGKSVPKIDMSSLTNNSDTITKQSHFDNLQVTNQVRDSQNANIHMFQEEYKCYAHPILNYDNLLSSQTKERTESDSLSLYEKTHLETENKNLFECAYFKAMFTCTPWIQTEITPNVKKYENFKKSVLQPHLSYFDSSDILFNEKAAKNELPPNAPAPDPFDHENFSFSNYCKALGHDLNPKILPNDESNSLSEFENHHSVPNDSLGTFESLQTSNTLLTIPSLKRALQECTLEDSVIDQTKQCKIITNKKSTRISRKGIIKSNKQCHNLKKLNGSH